ncbi:hypothetical protein DH2020_016834 [Rehmannia glutinosa]|uniref:Cold shock protein n=1 Tax=Rehmannia glutinosa TaxID=99300 RepID=A0ABR0WSM4_REHGL
MAASDLRNGTVKWFNDHKGFGFITPNDGIEDMFVHQLAIKSEGFRSLREGEAVEVIVEHGNDGRAKAANMTGPDGGSIHGGTHGGGGGGSYGRRSDIGGNYNGGSREGGGRSYSGVGGGCGGGGGYGDRGGGDRGCYKCGETGHMARECPQGGGGGGGGRYGGSGHGEGCYNRGEDGHIARECININH